MSRRLQVANVTLDSEVLSDPQDALPPTLLDLGGAGKVILRQSALCFVGTIAAGPEGGRRLIVATGRPGCNCGCGTIGVAFGATPSVDEARLLATQLTTFANEIEAEAREAAEAAIRRAAK